MKPLQWIASGLSFLIVLHATSLMGEPPAKDGDADRRLGRMHRNGGHVKIYDALKIAVDAMEAKQLMYRPDYKLQASRVGNEWVFWFVFLPETPGLDVTVFVSDERQTRFLPGF
jgi:hypothetical protein